MRNIKVLLSLALIFVILLCSVGCSNQEIIDAHINEPIAEAGDVAYFGAIDYDTRNSTIKEKHIEVTGIVTYNGGTLFKIDDNNKDTIYVQCWFSENSDTLDAIEEGDTITVHGVCIYNFSDYITMEGCELTQHIKASDLPNITDETVVPPTTESPTENPANTATEVPTEVPTLAPTEVPTSVPTKEPTPAPTKEPTPIPTPKPTKAPTPVPTKAPTPRPTEKPTTSEVLVWIPTNGGKKYHSRPSCSNMIDPIQVTKSKAVSQGFTACGRCYK